MTNLPTFKNLTSQEKNVIQKHNAKYKELEIKPLLLCRFYSGFDIGYPCICPKPRYNKEGLYQYHIECRACFSDTIKEKYIEFPSKKIIYPK